VFPRRLSANSRRFGRLSGPSSTPLWSSGQSFWLHIQRSRVRFPALPDFLSSNGSGTGSTQPREPREVNWGATWIKRSNGTRSRKQRLTAVGIRCADHASPLYPQKLALTSPTGGGRFVGIVRSRTKATEFRLVYRFHLQRQVDEVQFIELPLKMEAIECSETSAISTQKQVKHPKRKHVTFKTRRRLEIK
jgi:hypothetical protein